MAEDYMLRLRAPGYLPEIGRRANDTGQTFGRDVLIGDRVQNQDICLHRETRKTGVDVALVTAEHDSIVAAVDSKSNGRRLPMRDRVSGDFDTGAI